MGLLCCVLMLGVAAIWLMNYSREDSNVKVAEGILEQWGKSVYINGPTAKKNLDSSNRVTPQKFDCKAEVETKSLHRGIYEAEVYTANINILGSFSRDSLLALGDSVVLELGVDTKQLLKVNPLEICGKKFEWHKSDYFLFVKIELDKLPDIVEFSTGFDIRGSEAIFIRQVGVQSTVTINGEAANPSFNGYSLPIERSLSNGRQFTATWKQSVSEGGTYTDGFGYVGADFLVGVDRYQKVERSLKYSFIIILLTFISVLVVEINRKQPIPLLNYFLIGGALVIFYSLLLSFVELIPFGLAYLIASAMTVFLITGYMWKMLKSHNLGLTIGVVLAVMYLFCYVLLSMSTFALLLGSLLLFFSLAAMMYASLKIKN